MSVQQVMMICEAKTSQISPAFQCRVKQAFLGQDLPLETCLRERRQTLGPASVC